MLYHTSLSAVPVKQFIPTVPKARLTEEDNTIPRVCLSSTIKGCISGMPGGITTLINFKLLEELLDIKPFLGLYIFKNLDEEKLIKPNVVSSFVPDAKYTREHWYRGVINNTMYDFYHIRIIDFQIKNIMINKSTQLEMCTNLIIEEKKEFNDDTHIRVLNSLINHCNLEHFSLRDLVGSRTFMSILKDLKR